MSKILIGIPYLEGKDINNDGSLKPNVGKGKPVVVMIQGNFCGYCTKAKPDFQSFAKSTPSVVVATVQMDGDENDKQASQLLSKVNNSQGVPAYLGFDKTGRFSKMHNGGRDMASLQAFASSL